MSIARKSLPDLKGHVAGRDLGTDCTVLLVNVTEPGKGPALHVHPYDELFVIHAGRARYTIGEEEVEGGTGDVILGPANIPHKFTVTEAPFRSTDIHLSPDWIQTDLEDR